MIQKLRKVLIRPSVVTHNGSFHPDDITAVAIISLYEGVMPKIVRTRDENKIQKATYAVDVGYEYDEGAKRFDHHQPNFSMTYANGIPMASAGLVWKAYGAEICRSQEVAHEVAWRFIIPIDAEDSGTAVYEQKYERLEPYTLFRLLRHFLPIPTQKISSRVYDRRFVKAVRFVKALLVKEIDRARYVVQSQAKLDNIYKGMGGGPLIVITEDLSWRDWAQFQPNLLFVVVNKQEEERWSLYAVPSKQFDVRKELPSAWGGKKGAELADITGVEDAVFCHKGLFVAVANSKEGILKLAQMAIEA